MPPSLPGAPAAIGLTPISFSLPPHTGICESQAALDEVSCTSSAHGWARVGEHEGHHVLSSCLQDKGRRHPKMVRMLNRRHAYSVHLGHLYTLAHSHVRGDKSEIYSALGKMARRPLEPTIRTVHLADDRSDFFKDRNRCRIEHPFADPFHVARQSVGP